jgi:hypothetical protein
VSGGELSAHTQQMSVRARGTLVYRLGVAALHRTMIAVRPSSDRARPARAARSVVVRPDGQVRSRLLLRARRTRRRALDPIEVNSTTHVA